MVIFDHHIYNKDKYIEEGLHLKPNNLSFVVTAWKYWIGLFKFSDFDWLTNLQLNQQITQLDYSQCKYYCFHQNAK